MAGAGGWTEQTQLVQPGLDPVLNPIAVSVTQSSTRPAHSRPMTMTHKGRWGTWLPSRHCGNQGLHKLYGSIEIHLENNWELLVWIPLRKSFYNPELFGKHGGLRQATGSKI